MVYARVKTLPAHTHTAADERRRGPERKRREGSLSGGGRKAHGGRVELRFAITSVRPGGAAAARPSRALPA